MRISRKRASGAIVAGGKRTEGWRERTDGVREGEGQQA